MPTQPGRREPPGSRDHGHFRESPRSRRKCVTGPAGRSPIPGRARAWLTMAAAKKPLEFHAKRPWGPDGRRDESDEDDEDENEAESGFSMEEVLRLGGTKVTACNSRRRGPGARGERSRAGPRSRGVGRGWGGASWSRCPASESALCASGATSLPPLFTR